MTLQRIIIDDLYSGTSFQPAWKRFPGQVEVMTNIDPDTISGARDRNGTDFIAKLNFTGGAHWERLRDFRIIIRPSLIKIFDDNGNEVPVIDNTGSTFQYLASITPETDVDTVVIGNTVLILNKNITTAMTTSPDYVIKGQVNQFKDLINDQPDTPENPNPVAASNPQTGDIWQVLLNWNLNTSGYYKYNGGGQTKPGSWDLIEPPADPNCIWDNSTMPHTLFYDTVLNRWTFQVTNFASRKSGSYKSNPAPEFVGYPIQVMSYYQNRLLLMGNNVLVTTRGGNEDKLDVFIKDVNNTTATDPLSISNDQLTLGQPQRATVLNRDLIITCDRGVMKLTSGQDPLTDNNGRLYPIISIPCRPVKVENNGEIAIVTDYNNYVHSFMYQNVYVGATYAGKLNEHNPKVLQPDQLGDKVVRRVYILKDRIIIATDRDAALFKYSISNGQMVQAAWHTWQFLDSEHRLIYADMQGPNFRIVTKDDQENHYLLSYYPDVEPKDPDWEYLPALDYRNKVDYTAWNESLHQTGFDTSILNASENYWLVTNDNGINKFYKAVRWSGRRVWFQGDHRHGTYYIGTDYVTDLQLTSLYLGPINVKPLIKEVNIGYALNTTNFEVLWNGKDDGNSISQSFDSYITGTTKLGTSLNKQDVAIIGSLPGDARYHDLILYKRGPGRVIWSTVTYIVDAISIGGKY